MWGEVQMQRAIEGIQSDGMLAGALVKCKLFMDVHN